MLVIDFDSGVNVFIYFNIIEGNEDEVFMIDNFNGFVFFGKMFIVFFVKDDFIFIIEVYDEKDISKKDIVIVFVNVFLVDGFFLYFELLLNFSVKEGFLVGNKIVLIVVVIMEYVMYKIVFGNEDGVLEIDLFLGDLFIV